MPGVLGIALGLAATAGSDGSHSTMMLPGVLFATGRQGKDIGLELSLVHWPRYDDPQLYGVYAQAELGDRANRVSLGLEGGFSVLSLELGYARRFAGDGMEAGNGIQIAPYLSLGFLNVGMRYTQGLGGSSTAWGSEVAFVLSLKSFHVISGHSPDPIKLNMPHGRPLRDDSGAQIEPPPVRCVVPLSPEARHWVERGRSEQISVATFLRLHAELAAHDAPDDLLAACAGAAIDEIDHARACFARAEAIAGAPIVPGDLPVPPPREIPLAKLALESLHDGWIGEGQAAAEIEREAAADPLNRPMLERIACEERAHAELGMRILQLAISRDPALGQYLATSVLAERSRRAHAS